MVREKARRQSYPIITVIAILVIGILLGAGAAMFYGPVPSLQPVVEREPAVITGTQRASANIVAIAGDDGRGVVGTVDVEVRGGEGRVLISANPFIEPDTQDSINVAKSAAENALGVSLERSDIIVSFSLGLPANVTQIVGGPSAGSALAVAIIAAVQGKPVRPDASFTGTVEDDGTIGSVGGILEKAEAAGKAGMKIFIVPQGQANLSFYEKEVVKETRGGFVIQRIKYFPRTIGLSEYTSQWNMTAYEAATVAEAARLSIIGFEPLEGAERATVTGAAAGEA